MQAKDLLKMIDKYIDYVLELDTVEEPSEDQLENVKNKYTLLKAEVIKLCDNQLVRTIESNPDYTPPIPYTKSYGVQKYKCSCDGWGCFKCCSSEEEIRGRQGTYG